MASNEWLHGEFEVISSKMDEDAFQRLPAYVTLEEVLYAERLRLQVRTAYEERPIAASPFWFGRIESPQR